jgi:lipopolysaccharide export LptBFGC system permease protein LptF
MDTNNLQEKQTPNRKLWRMAGVGVSLIPILILAVAPSPFGFRGGGPAGYAFLFFILSVPLGLLVSQFGKNPARAKKIALVVAIVIAVFVGIPLLRRLF